LLPHAYPFRLLERASGPDGRPLLRWTTGGTFDRGAGAVPPSLVVEMMAQAALVALAGPAPGAAEPLEKPGIGLLAGLDGVEILAPLRAGETFSAEAELLGRLGRLLKVRVKLWRVEPAPVETVAVGDLLIALDAGSAS
jgi:hypothetical protein